MAENNTGGIVLSVNIDSSEINSDMKKTVDKIKKSILQEQKLAQSAEKTAQAKQKTLQEQEKTEQAVHKTLKAESEALTAEEKLKAAKSQTTRETAAAETALYKSLEAQQKAVNAEQAFQTEKAKTEAETRKAETAEINRQKAVTQTAIAEQNQKTAVEKTAQAKQKTVQEQQKTLINQEKIRQEQEKTTQAQKKTTQAQEKTAQAQEKTKQAQEKTKQAIIKTEMAQKKLKNATTKVSDAIKKMAQMLGVAFGVREIIRFSNETSKLASQQEANLKRLSMLYGQSAQEVYDFAQDNAAAFGMSKAAAYEAAADYGNIFTTFANGADSAKLTNDMLQATAVIASQTGRTYEDVFEKIRSGLYGNTRAIDDLGITVRKTGLMQTQAFQTVSGGVKKWNDLTDAELQNARALGIIEQANAKYGNTIMQSAALTRSQFNAAWDDFKATWGTAVNQVLLPVLQVLTKIMNTITQGVSAALKFFGKELVIASSGIDGLGDGASGVADSIDDATDSQKELNKEIKKSLAGFDEINILGDKKSKDTGATVSAPTQTVSVSTEAGGIDLSQDTAKWDEFFAKLQSGWELIRKKVTEVYNSIKKIALLFTKGFWDGFVKPDFGTLKTSIQSIGDDIESLFTSEDVQTSIDNFANSFVISFGQITGSFLSIGTTIATNLINGFSQYFDNNYSFIKERVSGIFDVSDDIATDVGNTFTAFSNIFSTLMDENGTTLTSSITGIFSNAALGITEIALKAGEDFINFLTQPIIDNQEKIKVALDDVLGYFSGITTSIESLVNEVVREAIDLYDMHISPLVESVTNTVSGMVDSFLDAWNTYISPVMEEVQEQFETLVEEHLKPMFEKISNFVGKLADAIKLLWDTTIGPFVEKVWKLFINGLLKGFGRMWKRVHSIFTNIAEYVSDIIGNFMDELSGVIDFLTGVFTGDWEKAWNGLKNVYKAVINNIIDLAEGMINTVIDGLNTFFVDNINAIIEPIADLVGKDWKIDEIKHISIPHLARGAVLPANNPFLAVVGDQKRGTNIEAPAELIKQMVYEAMDERDSSYGGQGVDVSISFEGTEARLIRYLSPKISKVNKYRGKNLLTGGQV